MKNLILTITASILFAGFSYASDETQSSKKDLSTAEMEFIGQCDEYAKICRDSDNNFIKCPEVVIINEDNVCLLSGSSSNMHIRRLKMESIFLTEVEGTSFYKIERHLPFIDIDDAIAIIR